jgi:hypothetical protein
MERIVSIWTAVKDPLQGRTSLSKVFWVYGVLGSVVVSAIGLAVDPGSRFATRIYAVFGFIFSVYVTVATYRCAGNCQSNSVARFVRICAVASLVLLPVFAYLEFTGAIGAALVSLRGEQ